jgi:hypothetical protein
VDWGGGGEIHKQYALRADQSTDDIVIVILVKNIRYDTWASDANVGYRYKGTTAPHRGQNRLHKIIPRSAEITLLTETQSNSVPCTESLLLY